MGAKHIPPDMMGDLIATLEILALEHLQGSEFQVIGSVPAWCSALYPEVHATPVLPASRFLFLENFLMDAELFWKTSGDAPHDRLKSGPWIEVDATGREWFLEASAVRMKERRILLIEFPKIAYQKSQELIQKARENTLKYDRLVRAEEALRRSEQRMRAVLQAIPDMILLVNRTGQCLDFSAEPEVASVARQTMAPASRVLGDLLPAEVLQPVLSLVAKTLETGQKGHLDYQATQDGGTRDFEARLSPGGNEEVLILIRDITDRKRNAELRIAKEAAEKAYYAKSRFLANMSHELLTPLNHILGYSDMVREEVEDLGQENLLPDIQKIQSATRHLRSLIQDVLEITKLESGEVRLDISSIDLATLVHGIVDVNRKQLEKNGNTLQLEIDPNLGRVRSDPDMLQRALHNVFNNACKFTLKGTVRFQAARHAQEDREWVQFVISDTGIGMSGEQMERMFEPFTQADEDSTRKFDGTGLGMTITRKFCDVLGGTLQVVSHPNRGTSVTLRFPSDPAHA